MSKALRAFKLAYRRSRKKEPKRTFHGEIKKQPARATQPDKAVEANTVPKAPKEVKQHESEEDKAAKEQEKVETLKKAQEIHENQLNKDKYVYVPAYRPAARGVFLPRSRQQSTLHEMRRTPAKKLLRRT